MKKIISFIMLCLLVLFSGGFKNPENDFTYRYKIYANSNSANDLITLYQEKEYLINNYQLITNSINEDEILQVLSNNINRIAKNGQGFLLNGVIVIVIGQGKGLILEGDLARNSCDNTAINKKIFIIDWLFG